MSNMTSTLKSNNWWEDNHNDDDGPPRVIHVRQMQDCGGLLSDTLVDDDELQNLDLDVVSILTDDQTAVPEEFSNEKQQHQGVNRVVEALRSIQIRRQSSDKESSGRASALDTPRATRQQRFFASSRQTKAQNSGIAQTPQLKREKSFLRTPDTHGSTPGKSSPQKDSDEKGIASLRRFLSFQKKAEPLVEPGLASMGEEDSDFHLDFFKFSSC
jgi:hypothetical protein